MIAAVHVLVAAVAFLNVSSARAGELDGEWIGAYGYEDGRQAVAFDMTLSDNGGRVSGQIAEVQSFGTEAEDGALRANISGSIRGFVVQFTKTYDGTGGARHSVTYKGTLVSDGNLKFIFGTWHLGGEVGSWFAALQD